MKMRALAWLALFPAVVGCEKSSNSSGGAATATAAMTAAGTATATGSAATAETGTATGSAAILAAASATGTVGVRASYTFICAVKPTEVYLAEGAKRAGPKDPDPGFGGGEATFTLNVSEGAITGMGAGSLGEVWIRGQVAQDRLIASFGPLKESVKAFQGTFDFDPKTGGILQASTGLADSARAGTCTLK